MSVPLNPGVNRVHNTVLREHMTKRLVKIAWTLRADPVGPGESIFRTETRVATTDPKARSRFRWYWSRFSPGIVVIRRVLLSHVKDEAERRARALGRP